MGQKAKTHLIFFPRAAKALPSSLPQPPEERSSSSRTPPQVVARRSRRSQRTAEKGAPGPVPGLELRRRAHHAPPHEPPTVVCARAPGAATSGEGCRVVALIYPQHRHLVWIRQRMPRRRPDLASSSKMLSAGCGSGEVCRAAASIGLQREEAPSAGCRIRQGMSPLPRFGLLREEVPSAGCVDRPNLWRGSDCIFSFLI